MSRNRNTFRLGALAALATGALALSGGLLLAPAAAATAAAAPPAATDVDHWVVPQTRESGVYWTPERMMAAIPGDLLAEDNVASAGPRPSGESATGTEKSVRPQLADPAITPHATAQAPVDHIGKVFFTLGGSDYVCSGNAVSSVNESTVATAGHCVNEGPGSFASRLIFVPAYSDGAAPFGQWTATDLLAPTQWTSGGDISYDTGFAIVSSPTGSTLSDTVGASGLAFNDDRGLNYTAFGYPAAAPFTGQTLQSCAGTATDDPFAQSESQGIRCDMTGGSSGGPWFLGGGSAGLQNSVNSFGYDSVTNTMFGPYWGSVIENTYDAAAS